MHALEEQDGNISYRKRMRYFFSNYLEANIEAFNEVQATIQKAEQILIK